jgi:hypothetical protein
MLKSEALYTLSLKAKFSFEANSAPTLHPKKEDLDPLLRVGALFVPTVSPGSAVGQLSRPNYSSHRTCANSAQADEFGR